MNGDNYEFISNIAPHEREKNYTNDFEAPISPIIDGVTKQRYMEITEITYPLTSKNILNDECSVKLTMVFNDVQKISSKVKDWERENLQNIRLHLRDWDWGKNVGEYLKEGVFEKQFDPPRPGKVELTINKYMLPSGSYDIETILAILNRYMNIYSIIFEQEKNKRVKIRFGCVVNYYVNLKKPYCFVPDDTLNNNANDNMFASFGYNQGIQYSKSDMVGTSASSAARTKPSFPPPVLAVDGGSLNEYRQSNLPSNIEYKITFSKKLAFILGMKNLEVNKTVTVQDKEHKLSSDNYIIGDYLPAQNAGEDRLYIYCDQIEGTKAGEGNDNLLISIPRPNNKHGEGGVTTFTPAKTIHKLKKIKISKFDIKVKDSAGKLVDFDSGTVTIKSIIS